MLLTLFCAIDDFCKAFSRYWRRFLLTSGVAKRIKPSGLCLSEVMTIMVNFHLSRYRTFKDYYLKHVWLHLRAECPGLVSYTRFVELMRGALVPLMVYLKRCRLQPSEGVAFVDSTTLKVCHNRRIYNHKTSGDLPSAAKRRWAGSMALSCTSSSPTRATWCPSCSRQGIRMIGPSR